ncbi:filamentous hemagglutinin N-terminal domain-containing protein [Mesorhizobium sp. GR13]|uniref:filamentous hemagglutinin N-terminal domain-containing protein n=1 Tax=Mesorhizobium sp. GR13 TaxID=2562308 RepID=UPI0010BFDAFA|nr:filamentous hemagglutinin N-terminal domain-containing protein [Mesorhizobium sp. GR13]
MICRKSVFGAFAYGITIVGGAHAQGLIPDETTPTEVTASPGGRLVVKIAPPDAGGSSLNRYSSFNVGKDGVDLDNAASGSRLIINEVTGRTSSKIEGKLSVTGQRANVIIANPNGISVDGGSFAGASKVLLTTSVAKAGQLAVGGATVSIGSGGLDTAGAPLDIVSAGIQIDGAVDIGDAAFNPTAGQGIAEYEVDPEGALSVDTRNLGSFQAEPAKITISEGAIINAGTIRIAASGANAEIDQHGKAIASTFQLQADGKIELGGEVSADGAISIAGGDIEIGAAKPAKLSSATSGIRVQSKQGDIALRDVEISAVARSTADFTGLGGVSLEAKRNLIVAPSGSSNAKINVSNDGLALIAGHGIAVNNLNGTVSGKLIVSAGEGTAIRNSSIGADTANLYSADKIQISSSIINSINGASIDGAEVLLVGDRVKSTAISSAHEGVTINARTGDLVVESGVIDANAITAGDATSTAAVSLAANKRILFSSLDKKTLSRIIASTGGVSLQAGQEVVLNDSAVSIGGDFSVNAGGNFVTATTLKGAVTGMETWRSGNSVTGRNIKVRFGYGVPRIADFQTSISASGAVAIAADSWINNAAAIDGSALDARLSGDMVNNSILTGSGEFQRRCFFICSASGWSNVEVVEGRIFSSGAFDIRSAGSVVTEGAIFTASLDMSVKAERFSAQSTMIPMIVIQRLGVPSVFGISDGWVSYGYDGGFVGSYFGRLSIDAQSIRYSGVGAYAGEGYFYSVSPDDVDLPQSAGRIFDYHSGFLSAILE